MAAAGDHLTMITAASQNGYTGLVTTGGFMYRPMEARLNNRDYPPEALNDYFKSQLDQIEQAADTISLFDPTRQVGAFSGRTLFTLADNRVWYQPLLDTFSEDLELYQSVQENWTDADEVDALLENRLNVPPMSRLIREIEPGDTSLKATGLLRQESGLLRATYEH